MRIVVATLLLLGSPGCLLFLETPDLEERACGSDADCLDDYRCDGLVCVTGAAGDDAGPVDAGRVDAGADAGGFDGGFDAGTDGGFDAGTDGGFDGGTDGGLDGGTDGGFDGGTDGGFDGGTDGGFDGGTDGGFDGGTDGGFDAGAMDAGCATVLDAGQPVCPGTVYDVKNGSVATGEAVWMRDMVVTAIFAAGPGPGFWAQLDPTSTDWTDDGNTGLFVFTDQVVTLAVGDTLSPLQGRVTEFFSQKQLVDATWTNTPNTTTFRPLTLTPADVATAASDGPTSVYEGMLVTMTDAAVTNDNAPPIAGAGDEGSNRNEFEINGVLHVDDLLYLIDPQPAQDDVFGILTGVLSWRNGLLKLLPRDAADVTLGTVSADIVINELDYDNFGPDTAEFAELLNKNGAEVDMTGWHLLFVNGATGDVFHDVDLSSVGTFAAGSYVVVHTAGVASGGGNAWIEVGSVFRNGPDAVVLASPTTVIDYLSYEGSVLNADLGVYGFVSLDGLVSVEDPGAGSLQRSPDGTDTGDDSADWQVIDPPTPGAANAP